MWLYFRYCNPAHQVAWENLKGVEVSSTPDLRLYKFGFGGYCAKELVSTVIQVHVLKTSLIYIEYENYKCDMLVHETVTHRQM